MQSGITSRVCNMQPMKWQQNTCSAPGQNLCNNQQLERIYHHLLADVTEDVKYIQEEFDRYFPSTTTRRGGEIPSEQLGSSLPEITNIFSEKDSSKQNSTLKSVDHQCPHLLTSNSSSQLTHSDSPMDTPSMSTPDFMEPYNNTLCKNEPQSPTNSAGSSSETDTSGSPNSEVRIQAQLEVEKEHYVRRTNKRKKGKLWEFLLELLMSEKTNPTIIRWEDKSRGVFKIIDCKKVAGLWGKRKSNPSMTYEKLSRALRYYYDLDIMMKIEGHKLLYQFGNLPEA